MSEAGGRPVPAREHAAPPDHPASPDSPASRQCVPFRQYVLKVHSRCNLACTYCYVYEGPDQSWRGRPVRMAETTVRRTAERIAQHVTTHGLRSIRVDLHGGEPLLAGPAPLIGHARAVRDAVPADCAVAVSVQTNGTLLTADTLRQLSAAGLTVGLSLDGGSARLNHRRVDHAGRSSWPAVRRAAALLAGAPAAYGGILCTIDVATDPAEVYRSLVALGPTSLDFLLPYGNWSRPPPGLGPFAGSAGRAERPVPYGEWLVRVFDLWWDTPPGHRPVPVRLFTEIVALLLGAASRSESVGLSPLAVVVIDTDGTIQRLDSLKTAYAGAPDLGMDVFRHDFEAAARHPHTVAAQARGLDTLCGSCRRCPVVRVCGGGRYTDRYLHGSGFDHPSVYCADLEHLIRHIGERLQGTVDGT
ncbi:FxsB family cyclophane-forming radical SAM/SPASM peptide maturase [Streptomyces sp. NPDC052496]|uniref:FxsB family cyclophane-forming radical SAM/SPASM peptide maturase n=1 Tax=Streptomyces sp. NPDC052496 TaxID=3154951 RepID=UPI00342A7075